MAAYLLFEVMVMLLSRLNDVVWSPWLLGLDVYKRQYQDPG